MDLRPQTPRKVQAVDLLLMTRYGAEASWWDCRAVERALVCLRPDKRPAMSRLPADYRIEAAVAIGRPGDPATLDEKLRAREQSSGRRPVAESVIAGPISA